MTQTQTTLVVQETDGKLAEAQVGTARGVVTYSTQAAAPEGCEVVAIDLADLMDYCHTHGIRHLVEVEQDGVSVCPIARRK